MDSLRKISRRYYGRQIVACWLVSLMLFGLPVQLAMATPTNPDVVAGGATVDQSGNTTTVNMVSGEAVINWDSLNTYSSEVLQFLKAQGGFAVLNRVVQGGATQFDGSLFGNQGYIIIVNPQGVVFGPTSIVQAHQFTASTLDISNDDFMNGIYSFAGGGVGEIANYGNISAEQVALIGKKVLNAGVIRSPGGYVLMAAGDKVFLGQEGSDVFVEVEAVTVPQGTLIEGLGDVINEGTIEAAAGQVVLAAGDTFSRAIEGLDTMALAAEGGTGRVGQFGTINVDGVEGDGGSVTLTAGEVVALGPDSLTTANAGTNGDGGDVIVYSPYTALFNSGAWVEAKGGSESGDGGFFELSGKEYVEVWGDVDLGAAAGEAGNFLIDPRNIRIADWAPDQETGGDVGPTPPFIWLPGGGGTSRLDIDKLETYLNTQNVTIDNTADLNPATGWITFGVGGGSLPGRNLQDGPGGGSGYSLTVNAHDYIKFGNPGDSDSGVDFTGGGNLTLNAGAEIITRADTFNVAGDLIMDAGNRNIIDHDFIESDSPLISTGGGIDLVADGDIHLQNTLVSAQADGVLRLIADDDGSGSGNLIVDGSLQGNMELSGYNVTVDGTVTSDDTLGVYAENNINLKTTVSSDNDMLMMAGNNITLNEDAGNTTSDGWMELVAGLLNDEGDVTAHGLLETTDAGYMYVGAADDVSLYGTPASAISAGLLKLEADGDEYDGGDLYVAGHLYGNMELSGYDVTVDGMVESTDTLEVYAENNIRLKDAVSSADDMVMEAGHSITLNEDAGNTSSGGQMELYAGWYDDDPYNDEGDITAHGLLRTTDDENGDMYVYAPDNISLNGTPASADSAGLLQVVADGDEYDGGDLYAAGHLYGNNMLLVGYDVTVDGMVISGGTIGALDVYAENNIQLKKAVSSVDAMEMIAGNNITLNEDGGNTSSGGVMVIEAGLDVEVTGKLETTDAGDDMTVQAARHIFLNKDGTSASSAGAMLLEAGLADDTGDVTVAGLLKTTNAGDGAMTVQADDSIFLNSASAAGEMNIEAGLDNAEGDVVVAGLLETTDDDDLTVEAADNIELNGMTTSADSAGLLNLIAGGDLYVAGDLYGNMTLSGYDVTVEGAVTSAGILDVDAENNIQLEKNVSSALAMTMDAGRDITLNEDSGSSTTSGSSMALIAGKTNTDGDVTAHGLLETTTGGTMTVTAGDSINLNKDATSARADGAMYLEAGLINDGGDVVVAGLLETTNAADGAMEVYAADSIFLNSASAAGEMNIEAGLDNAEGDVEVAGLLETTDDDDLTVEAADNIELNGMTTSADSAGLLNLIAGGDLYVAGDLFGNMTLSGYDVTVEGAVTSAGILDVDAENNIQLEKNVSSALAMTMDAGRDITLNEDSGSSTTSGSSMALIAGKTNTEGDVTAHGLLETTTGGTMTVTAGDSINLNKDATSARADGAMYLEAGLINDGGDVVVAGLLETTNSSDGDMTVEAADSIFLNSASSAGVMNIEAGKDNPEGDVVVAGLLETTDDDDLTVEAADDISLNGAPTSADSAGLLNLIAGGDLYAAGDLFGNMTLSGYDVTVEGAVTSAGILDVDAENNIQLEKNVSSALAMTMDAGRDITLNEDSGSSTTSGSSMALIAGKTNTDGDVTAHGLLETTTGGTMTVTAGDSINLNKDATSARADGAMYLEAGLKNDGGDVVVAGLLETTNAADGAMTVEAARHIYLNKAVISARAAGEMNIEAGKSDADGDVDVAGLLETTNPNPTDGDMTVAAADDIFLNNTPVSAQAARDMELSAGDDVYAYGDLISVDGSIDIYSSESTTFLTGDKVEAYLNITLHNNTELDGSGNQTIDALNGTLDADSDVTKVTPGDLTLGGGSGIELAGDVQTTDGHLIFGDGVTADGIGPKADQVFDADGVGKDLIANDDIIKTTAGSLTLGAGEQPEAEIYLAGDVKTSNGDLIFWDKVIADGSSGQVFDADGTGTDLIADDDIIKTTAGSLTLGAGSGEGSEIYLPGNVTTTDGDLIFWDKVIANGSGSPKDQLFDADGVGKRLIADDDIIKTTPGNLTLGAGSGSAAQIELGGDVKTEDGHLIFWDKVIANDDSSDQVFDADGEGKDLIATDDIIKTTDGSLTLGAGDQPDAEIYLAGDVQTSNGDLIFWDKVIANDTTSDQVFDADGDGADLIADDDIIKTTPGSLTLGAGEWPDAEIYLPGDVTTTDGDLIFWDKVIAHGDSDQVFDADGESKNLIADDDIIKTTDGSLTLGAGEQHFHDDATIYLGGDVKTEDGDLIFWDKVIAYGSGPKEDQVFDADGEGKDLIADDDIIKTTDGSLTLGAGHPGAGSEIRLAGDVLTHDGDLIFWDKVIANDTTSDQVFDADGEGADLIADDDIIKTTAGSLTLGAGEQPDAEIYLPGDVTTVDGDLIFWDKVVAHGDSDQVFDADGEGADLIADDDIIKTTDGSLTLGAGEQPDATIYLAGDVLTHDGDLIFWDKVIANDSSSDQVFDADGEGADLIADDDIIKTTEGSLTLGAGEQPGAEIYLPGDVTTVDGDLIFWDKVVAHGDSDQVFDADGEGADLIADDDIIKTTAGSLTLGAGEQPDAEIYLPGDVTTVDGDLIFWDKVVAHGDSDQVFDADGEGADLIADDDIIKTTDGSLTLGAGEQPDATIYLAGDVLTHDGDLIFWDKVIANDSSSDQVFDADGEGADLIADDDIIKTTEGSLTLGAGEQPGAEIYLPGDVTTVDGDLIFWDKVVAHGDSDQVFDADGEGADLIADDDIIKTTAGSLTLGAGEQPDAEIYLPGDVTTVDGDLIFWDKVVAHGDSDQVFDADGEGADLIADDDIIKTTDGSLTLGAGEQPDATIYLAGDVLTHDGDLIFWDKVIANDSSSDQVFDADGEGADLIADDDIIKTTEGSLTLGAGEQPGAEIYLPGDVTTVDGDLIFWDKVVAHGDSDQVFDADGEGADLIADDDIIKTTAGSLTLGAGEQPDAEIYLPGDVTTVDGDLIFWDKVVAHGDSDQVFDADGEGADLIADDDIIKTTDGSLTLGAGEQPDATIYLAGDVLTHDGDLIFWDKVIANDSSSDQVFDADGEGADLIADDDIIKTTEGSLTLGAGEQPDAEIYLPGDVTTVDGDLIFWDKVVAHGDSDQVFDADGEGADLIADDDIIKTTAGSLTLGAGEQPDAEIYLPGDVTTVDGDLIFWDKVVAHGDSDQVFDADGEGADLIADDDIIKTTDGSLTLGAGEQPDATIYLAGDVLTHDGDLIFWDKVIANDSSSDQVFDADGEGTDLIADDDIIKTTAGNLTLGAGSGSDAWIDLNGDVIVQDGSLTVWDKFEAFGDLIASKDILLTDEGYFDGTGSPLDQTVNAQNGTLTAESWLWKTTAGNLYLLGNNDDPEYQDGKAIDLQYAGCLPAASTSLGNLELYAENGDIQISGDLTTFGYSDDGPECSEWYDRPTGGVSIIADNGKIYTDGASPDNDTLNIGIVGNSNQYEGLGVALPYDETKKAAIVVMSNENLNFGPDTVLIARGTYLPALGNDVPGFFTYYGDFGDFFDGYASWQDLIDAFGESISDFEEALGLSGLDLEAIFVTESNYEAFLDLVESIFDGYTGVDDRPAINFLANPGVEIPPGSGIIRDEGQAIDVAIYLASTGTDTDPGAGQGDVHLDARAIDVADHGTMVVDAYDTVTFGDFDTFDLSGFEDCADLACMLIKLGLRFHEDIDFEDLWIAYEEYEDGYEWDDQTYKDFLEDFLNYYFDEGFFFNIDRMEVCSRITEWLYQAPGRLPFAMDAGGTALFEAFIGGDYILRGAGLGNPGITDGRAWVLMNPADAAPLGVLAIPKVLGCPAEVEAAAGELGLTPGNIQVAMAGALAQNPTIQPCEACRTLINTASILRDEDGSRMAAMVQVFNTVAPPDAPFTPGMAASIATAFAEGMADPEAPQYATAMEYVDAFVAYVTVLETELGAPVGDSVAFVMDKYGAGIAGSDNGNIAAFVATRLETISE